jgi:hypothetical protein
MVWCLFTHFHPIFQSFSTDEITQIYDKIAHDIEQYLLSQCALSQQPSPLVQSLPSLLEAVLLARNSREIVTALALLQKVSSAVVCLYSYGSWHISNLSCFSCFVYSCLAKYLSLPDGFRGMSVLTHWHPYLILSWIAGRVVSTLDLQY